MSYRSPKLLKAARDQSCAICGSVGTAVYSISTAVMPQSENGKRSAQRRLNHRSTTVQPSHQPKGNSSSSSASSSAIKKEEEGASPLPLLPDGLTVEEVLAAWNQIPGAKPIAAKNLSPGRGIHKPT